VGERVGEIVPQFFKEESRARTGERTCCSTTSNGQNKRGLPPRRVGGSARASRDRGIDRSCMEGNDSGDRTRGVVGDSAPKKGKPSSLAGVKGRGMMIQSQERKPSRVRGNPCLAEA